MSTKNFYLAKVIIELEDDKGRSKRHEEHYLVEGVCVTDVETIINTEFQGEHNFELRSVSKTKIVEVLGAED